MRLLDKLRLRFRSVFRRDDVERELTEELQFHIDQQTEEYVASGMPPEEARMAALRSLGGVAQLQEECRDMRQMNIIEDLWRDMRQAARTLRRSPGFTAVAAVTLALGIGATTAIFSVVHGVLLKPLPYPEPDRLVGLYHRGPGLNLPLMNQGPATYFTYLDNNRSFDGLGAWDRQEVTITGRGEPELVEALAVTEGMLRLLQVQPVLGRIFSEEDDRPASPLRVVLTYGYWKRKFGGSHDAVGQPLDVDGAAADVIGVLPPSFRFLRSDPAVLVPMRLSRAEANRLSFGFQALARLKPGVSLAAANADVARMIPIVEQVPGFKAVRLEPNIRPLAQDIIGSTGRFLWILMGAVGLVLLIACANVANLLLVRAEGRQQEFAVRAALGAKRSRIARELLAESLTLGIAGGAAGLLLARGAVDALRRFAPATLPRVDEISIDGTALLFTIVISVLSGILFGVIPVVKLGAVNTAALKEGGRAASDGPGRQRTRNTLVMAEIAMALVLLITSGLMIRTFVAMNQVDPGFVRPQEVQTFRIEVPEGLAGDAQKMAQTHHQIVERLRQVPGVVSAGFSSSITMDGEDNANPLRVEHVHVPEGEMPPLRRFKNVAPGYFETMGNPIVAGRSITWTEIYQRKPVVVISENLAREYWGSASSALGNRVRGAGLTWHEIVGVVGNERDDGLDQPETAIVYWPLLNENYMRRSMAYAVRSDRVGSPGFLRELQQAVWSVNATLPIANVLTLEEIQDDSMVQTSFAMVILVIAASVALLLGVVGIYGVISYIAAHRRREVGIRMALGAQARDVRRLFLRHGLLLTGCGIVIGICASLALTRIMSALLFGVSPADPLTFATFSLGLAGCALLATWLPAYRASRIDPVTTLRGDS